MIKYFYTILFAFISFQGRAQLCQGSLGDPIVNITFGAGGNPGAPLAAAATGYQFVAGDCPNDGFYTVRNNTNGCFGNTWHSLPIDHTADGNGYFMLVNASILPSAFFIDTVKGLCGNSTYEFAAWIINVITTSSCNGNSNQPNLSFTIEKTDGTVLQSYNSGNIPPASSPLWKQYGFFFTTPAAGSDIVLRIVNNAPGGCGNDLALDDITFRPCGPLLTPSITGLNSTTANICEGVNKSFTFSCSVSAGFNNPVFQWQQRFNGGIWVDIAGATSTTLITNFIPANPTGNYEYRLNVAEAGNINSLQCRITSQPVTVIINPNPVIIASNNGPVCSGSNLTLTATGGIQYNWTGPNNFTATGASATVNNIQLPQAGIYNVVGSNAAGCSNTGPTTVAINLSPVAGTSFSAVSICIKDSVQLFATGGIIYQWLPAAGLSGTAVFNPKASPDTTTKYMVVVTDQIGCKDSAYVNIQVFTKAIANAGPDKIMIQGGWVTLSGSIQGSYLSYFWSPPTAINNTQALLPVVSPAADAAYVLTVLSNSGCGISTDTVLVKLYKDIFIPNAFSPNGDAINPTWNIPALNAYPDFELTVFNRYGEVVFHNRNINKPWDGSFKDRILPIGAYTYLINLNDSGKQILKGTVMIIR